MIAAFDHPRVGRYRGFAGAFRHEGAAAAPRSAPTFGEHSDAVLAELGYGTQDIARLRGAGAVT